MDALVALTINGVRRQVEADPSTNLLEVLRNDLGLTGTKYGCGETQCGACTVLLDGAPVRSCTTPLSQVVGKRIVTIEGLETDGKLHPVQQAFLETDAMQCGYCVSGMIMSAVALLERVPNPTKAQIVEAMNGNICRCCAYPKMIEAIERAAAKLREDA